MTSSLGEKIRALRKKNRMTLEELGNVASSSKSYIWELENREPPRPSAEKLQKIATALGVTVEYLLDPQEHEAPSSEVFDEAFYRKYQKLDPPTKARIREIVDVWSKKD